MIWGLFSLIVTLLVGCTSQGASLTLAAEHQVQGTRMFNIQTTASVQAGRVQSTQDYYTTESAFAATQSQFLKTTLIARGTPQDVLDSYQQQIESGGLSLPSRTPRPSPTFEPLIPPTPLPGLPAAAASPAVGGDIGAQSALTVPPPATGSRLVNLTASPAVGDDDCAQNATTTFPISTPKIYIVATAYEVASGMTLSSQWDISGQKRTFDYVPDFAIDGACIWFYIDQSEFAFQPGEARVSVTLNGTSMGTVTFTLN